jgi:hypothetical protein
MIARNIAHATCLGLLHFQTDVGPKRRYGDEVNWVTESFDPKTKAEIYEQHVQLIINENNKDRRPTFT